MKYCMCLQRWRCTRDRGYRGFAVPLVPEQSLLNSLRLMYSRLASHSCPNGHYVAPTLAVAAEQPIYLPDM